ncbi:hypothetical protein BTA51_22285 [Hahella sp. CCB-MM4]|uniref:Hpt domain-containing protein n=1 Tax=Hahella sp. (strain CCB-MM4) TaxID=1926491 RepID=UPI000B9A7A16|nr:Hpt domain-containing protein [Hahella sp. CCB-MM4]OZG71111.1 hypothetical protein BTA51_22285 [Hahella sp. CCB-MM4]
MSKSTEELAKLLIDLRERFVAELDERCDFMESLVLSMEKNPYSKNQYNELYRRVHSLKGSGGTYGFSSITAGCHQLENLLTECPPEGKLPSTTANNILAYVDLFRRVKEFPHDDKGQIEICNELESLSKRVMKKRWLVMVAEESPMLRSLYHQALEHMPVKIVQETNGLSALTRLIQEPFELAIVGRELYALNGIAILSALRVSNSNRRHIPAILVTSRDVTSAERNLFHNVLKKDEHLAGNICQEVEKVISR